MRIDELEVDALAVSSLPCFLQLLLLLMEIAMQKAPRNSTAPINRIPPQDDERRLFQGSRYIFLRKILSMYAIQLSYTSRGQFDPKAVPVIKPSPVRPSSVWLFLIV